MRKKIQYALVPVFLALAGVYASFGWYHEQFNFRYSWGAWQVAGIVIIFGYVCFRDAQTNLRPDPNLPVAVALLLVYIAWCVVYAPEWLPTI